MLSPLVHELLKELLSRLCRIVQLVSCSEKSWEWSAFRIRHRFCNVCILRRTPRCLGWVGAGSNSGIGEVQLVVHTEMFITGGSKEIGFLPAVGHNTSAWKDPITDDRKQCFRCPFSTGTINNAPDSTKQQRTRYNLRLGLEMNFKPLQKKCSTFSSIFQLYPFGHRNSRGIAP